MSDEQSLAFVPLRSVGKDRTGEMFGAWTVLGYAGNLHWWCKCKCGLLHKQDIKTLRKGRTLGCKKCSPKAALAKYKRGRRLHSVWNGMIHRCSNAKNRSFKNYGARGITVCQEWKENFHLFADWALSHGYQEDLTIERVNVNGNYTPENCTWIVPAAQARNKTTSKYLTAFGKTDLRCAMAERYGIDHYTLISRLKRGWDIEKALSTPPRPIGNLKKENLSQP